MVKIVHEILQYFEKIELNTVTFKWCCVCVNLCQIGISGVVSAGSI